MISKLMVELNRTQNEIQIVSKKNSVSMHQYSGHIKNRFNLNQWKIFNKTHSFPIEEVVQEHTGKPLNQIKFLNLIFLKRKRKAKFRKDYTYIK